MGGPDAYLTGLRPMLKKCQLDASLHIETVEIIKPLVTWESSSKVRSLGIWCSSRLGVFKVSCFGCMV